jgi:hypothetical protein
MPSAGLVVGSSTKMVAHRLQGRRYLEMNVSVSLGGILESHFTCDQVGDEVIHLPKSLPRAAQGTIEGMSALGFLHH